MRTITGMGIILRMVTNLTTRVVPLTDTVVGITRTCTIGIVNPFTAVAISAASPVKDHRCVDLISDVLPFGRHATVYMMHFCRSADAMIRVYDAWPQRELITPWAAE